jgi:hypothetical protein
MVKTKEAIRQKIMALGLRFERTTARFEKNAVVVSSELQLP